MKILIIGGVAGGSTAAARIRRLNEDVEILILERGKHISFANCGLPYFIGDTIKSVDRLLVQTPEKMKELYNIDVKINTEVLEIDPNNKKLLSIDLVSNTKTTYEYDKLLVSTGAEPIIPNIKGAIDSENIFKVRTIDDAIKIKEFIKTRNCKQASVIGGGFIGLEVAEQLSKLGLNVNLIEARDQILPNIDSDLIKLVEQNLIDNNINLNLNSCVEEILDNGKTIKTANKTISQDIIIMAIGVRPEILLAKNSNLEIGITGGVKTNKFMQTSNSNIYWIGDSCENIDFITKKPSKVALAGPAQRQARIAANHIILNDNDDTYKGTLATSIIDVYGLAVASCGKTEKELIQSNTEYKLYVSSPSDHAGFYPNANVLHTRLLVSKDDDILGFQAVGRSGADKAVDIIATAIYAGLKASSLKDLEHAYAPQFSSAKSPINILGLLADNYKKNIVTHKSLTNIASYLNDGIILDVRNEDEVLLYGIENAINIPLSKLRKRYNELDKSKKIYCLCNTAKNSYVATRILIQKGYDAYNLSGGIINHKLKRDLVYNDCSFPNMYKTEKKEVFNMENKNQITTIDCIGLQCPGPIMQVANTIKQLNDGDILEVVTTDPGFSRDIISWCEKTKNTFIENKHENNKIISLIAKGNKDIKIDKQTDIKVDLDNGTIVVFSGDFDKAIAAFIIASGAQAMGKQMTIFFTFWGLTIIKKKGVKIRKKGLDKMFSMMLPNHAGKLPLSKMNFKGMGRWMMKKTMKKKNVTKLQDLMQNAILAGVRIVACSMSMDVMGIRKEELIDGCLIGGVATYLGYADQSNLNLFI